MSLDRQKRVSATGSVGSRSIGSKSVALGALAVLALALAGCSSPIADLPTLDASSDASAKPKDTYLPVHDIPPERDEALIPPDQRAKIEAELAAARDRQASAAAQNANAK